MTAEPKPRIILDTNTIISGVLFKGAVPRAAVQRAFDQYQVIFSTSTWDELADVFQRDKFDKALPRGQRYRVLAEIARRAEVIEPTSQVHDCRDPRDNKFLALALYSQSSLIVSGDQDLLVLHPWRGVRILSPGDFIREEHGED